MRWHCEKKPSKNEITDIKFYYFTFFTVTNSSVLVSAVLLNKKGEERKFYMDIPCNQSELERADKLRVKKMCRPVDRTVCNAYAMILLKVHSRDRELH